MRRLPVYFLLDTSGSMYGEPVQAMNNALRGMVHNLRTDPHAAETLWISVITFDREARVVVPLTSLPDLLLPEINCPRSGPTHTGQALVMLLQQVATEIRKGTATQKGDWRPLLFLFTDGKPSDLQVYIDTIPKVKAAGFGMVVACAAGGQADVSSLKALTDTVVQLDTADSSTLKQFFRWVSDTLEQGNKSMGAAGDVALPAPPGDLHLVI